MSLMSNVPSSLAPANNYEFTLSAFYPPQNSTPEQIVEKAKACLLCLYGNIESAKISKFEYYNYVKFHWDKSQELYDRQDKTAKKIQKICGKLILQGVMHKLFDKELVVKLKDTYEKPLKLNNYYTIQLSLISPMISNVFTYECKESKDNFLDLNLSKDTFLKFIKMDKNFAISSEESISHILEYYEGANYLGIDWLKRKLTNYILKNTQNLDIESQKSVYNYFSNIITDDSKQVCESIFINMGEHYIQQSQWNEAAILMETAMKNKMDVSLITYLKSSVHTAKKDYASALETINIAIEQNSKDPRYYIHRAHVNHLLSANTKAILDLDTALILDPKNVLALCKRGKIFHKLGNSHKALDNYNQALQIDTDNEYALERRCKIFQQQNNQEQASTDVDRILSINRNNVFALIVRGNFHYKEGNEYHALEYFNKALQIDPNNVDALNYRG
jgi:tetratricopeptide (TPR) repeat protein